MPYYYTQSGIELEQQLLSKATQELANIRKEKAVAYQLSGDGWHDNPGFNQLQLSEEGKAREVTEIQSRLADSRIVDVSQRNTDKVAIGSIVRCERFFHRSQDSREDVWEIVGYGEAEPEKGRLSYLSPNARAILGLLLGDSRESHTPQGRVSFTVLELYDDWPNSSIPPCCPRSSAVVIG